MRAQNNKSQTRRNPQTYLWRSIKTPIKNNTESERVLRKRPPNAGQSIPSHWRVSVLPFTVRNHDNSPGWWRARVDRCWVAQRRDTYAIAPYFPMYPAFSIFCTRGSLSGSSMVHHSGSIQSFKQQKGQCTRWFCWCLCDNAGFGGKCGAVVGVLVWRCSVWSTLW